MEVRQLFRRAAFFIRRTRFDRELEAEITFHVNMRADELTAAGLSRRDALAQARREFGSSARAREASREAWQFRWVVDAVADIRYALRAFRRSPGFALTAIGSLALGIGANSTVFSAVDAVFWKPLPVAEPEQLVRLDPAPPRAFAEQLRRAGVFADLVATSADGLTFSYDNRAERIVGEVVSPNFFGFIGIDPVLGPGFSRTVLDGQWAPEAVLSYRFWQRRFGGDPDVVGRVIHLNTYPFTIVGVSPASFFDLTQGFDPELRIPFLPLGQEVSQIRQISGSPGRVLLTMARLKPGMTPRQAESAADVQLEEFLRTATVPQVQRPRYRRVQVLPGETGWSGDLTTFRTPLLVLMALVSLVLLIACANIANMLLARGLARQRELAVRASIGADRRRLVRQMLAESLLLAACGGAIGVGVGYVGGDVLLHFLPQGHISIVLDLRPDSRVLTFTVAVSLACALLFGLLPAFQVTRGDLAALLKADSAGSVGGSHGARTRRALVAGQVAFSVVLLIVAGVSVRALATLRPIEFDSGRDRVLLFTMKPQQEIYSPARIRLLVGNIVRQVATLPGVRSVAIAENGPLGSRSDDAVVGIPGRNPVRAAADWVTPTFFETVGIPWLAGRDFSTRDTQATPPVAIVNRALARALFGDHDPIGRFIESNRSRATGRFQIVGVAGDVHYYEVRTQPQPAVWFAIQQGTPYMPTLHVRVASADVTPALAAVRREFDAVDRGFPVFNIKTLDGRIDDVLARERLVAGISKVFGWSAVALAGMGLYGILAYSVSRRTREIGVRVTLGSSMWAVLWLVIREALAIVVAGAVAGVAIAMLGGRLVTPYVYGISPMDPVVLLSATATMLVIALLAVSVPAYRAARLDPLRALRSE